MQYNGRRRRRLRSPTRCGTAEIYTYSSTDIHKYVVPTSVGLCTHSLTHLLHNNIIKFLHRLENDLQITRKGRDGDS
jgi:hypothetical protein